MKLCSITPALAGGLELRLYEIGHAAGSKKSLGVTRPPETAFSLPAKSHDGLVSPRRTRLMAVRSTPTSLPTYSSLKPVDDIHSLSFMGGNVQYTHSACQAPCAPEFIDLVDQCAQNAQMARIARKEPEIAEERVLGSTYLKAWRKKKGLTQDDAAPHFGMTRENLSKIENSKSPYGQGLLETAAALYHCKVVDLLERHPDDTDPCKLFRSLSASQRKMIEGAIRGMLNDAGDPAA